MQETKESQVQSLGWEDPLGEKMEPAPVFLPGKSHEQRRLVGYSSWGRKELDMIELLNTQALSVPLTAGALRTSLDVLGVEGETQGPISTNFRPISDSTISTTPLLIRLGSW